MWFPAVALFLGTVTAQYFPNATDPNNHTDPIYSPARPPAVPLAVRSPYTSAWSSTSGNGTLNSNGAIFWTGTALGWEGIVTVDGVAYEWLGLGGTNLPDVAGLQTATPLTVDYDSQYSNFTFAAGPVQLTASFLSSVLPTDLCRTSIPLSYLSVSVKSMDGQPHSVQLYNDINGAWISYEANATLLWDIYEGGPTNPVNGTNVTTPESDTLFTWLYSLEQQYLFGEDNQFPQWGNMTFSSSQGSAQNITFQSGSSTNVRFQFVTQGTLTNIDDDQYRGYGNGEPVFAFAHDIGSVDGSGSEPVLYSLGSVQEPAIRYLTSTGIVSLDPYWKGCYNDLFSMIQYHYSDFAQSQVLAAAWDSQLRADVQAYYGVGSGSIYPNSTEYVTPDYHNYSTNTRGAEYIFFPKTTYGFLDPVTLAGVAVPNVTEPDAYYSIIALSARQVMGAYCLAIPPSTWNGTDPFLFQKEISSDGNVNTVDVMFPAMPFFVYANIDLLKYNMDPLYQNQEGGFYPNSYSMHDLGSSYPNATGHVEGNDEYMPVEECGNMVLMTYAYYYFTGDSSYLSQHYNILKQWSQYLIEYSLFPGNQVSTDDFAGALANQTNLAIKGIVALAAMSEISSAISETADATSYATTAQEYYGNWTIYAIDPTQNHTLLAYNWRSSYGLLYNIFPSLLLSLDIIPQSLFDMQSAYYPQVSQIFGVPLDTRHSETKSDWELWTAASSRASTRALFVDAVGYWINETSTNLPLTDLYDTGTGGYPGTTFIARPVVGGHFSLMSLFKAGRTAADENTLF